MEDFESGRTVLDIKLPNDTSDMPSNNATIFLSGNQGKERLIISLLIICLSMIALAGVFGNSLVVIAVCRIRTLNSVTDYFICSLACADLFVSAVIMPFAIVTEVSKGKWLFGPAFCSIWSSMDILCCTASVWNLCAISLDRYLAILKPLVYRDMVTPRMCCLSIITVWVFSTVLALSQLLWKYLLGGEDPPYTCIYAPDPGFRIYATLSAFFIPMSITVIVYSRIIPVAMKQARAVSNMEVHISQRASHRSDTNVNRINEDASVDQAIKLDSLQYASDREVNAALSKQDDAESVSSVKSATLESSLETGGNPSHHKTSDLSILNKTLNETSKRGSPHTSTKSNSTSVQGPSLPSKHIRKSRNKEWKVIRALVMVVGVFFVCWVPFAITIAIEPFLNKPLSIPMMSVFLWLGYFNSVSNPIIYVWLNKAYRRAFKRVLYGRRYHQDDESVSY